MFETGKIYTPIGFLPGLTRTGRSRPQATLRDDAVLIFLGPVHAAGAVLGRDPAQQRGRPGRVLVAPAHGSVPRPGVARGLDRDRAAASSAGPQGPRHLADPARLRPRRDRAPAGRDRRTGRHDLARRLRLREPGRLDLQPAASGPVHLRRDAGHHPGRLGVEAPRKRALVAGVPARRAVGHLGRQRDALHHPPVRAVLRRRRGPLDAVPGRSRGPRGRLLRDGPPRGGPGPGACALRRRPPGRSTTSRPT